MRSIDAPSEIACAPLISHIAQRTFVNPSVLITALAHCSKTDAEERLNEYVLTENVDEEGKVTRAVEVGSSKGILAVIVASRVLDGQCGTFGLNAL